AKWYMNTPVFSDEPFIPIGFKVQLENKSFNSLNWNDGFKSWNEIKDESITITWKNVDYSNYYEAEWIVEKLKSLDSNVYFKKSFKTKDLNEKISFILPYEGKYNVTLVLYGYDGKIS